MPNKSKLIEYNPSTNIKIAFIWASLMSCFIYCDYFGLYKKGTIMEMNDGIMGPLGQVSDIAMIGVSAMMAIPSLMICLSAILPANINRPLNILYWYYGAYFYWFEAVLCIFCYN